MQYNLRPPGQPTARSEAVDRTSYTGNDREKLPAITHTDGSARVQTLKYDSNPRIYRLLNEFKSITNYPILLNTSFNLKDQTMVKDSQEAIDTFMKCDMDYLVLGNLFLSKKILSENI